MSTVLTWFVIGGLLILGWLWYEWTHAAMEADPGHPFEADEDSPELCTYYYEVGAASRYCDRLRSAHADAVSGNAETEDDICPGHYSVTGDLIWCGLPFGHRGVSELYDQETDDTPVCSCTMLSPATPWEPSEWEQADDCPVHPLHTHTERCAVDRECPDD